MENNTQQLLIQVSALRKVIGEMHEGLEAQMKSEQSTPRQRRNKKFDRKVDMAANFMKYNKK